jgi:NADPH:quinone reductase-like Zn-dependent oxidoreductase
LAPKTIRRGGGATCGKEERMRVLQIEGAYGLDHLKFAERPDPTPGPGQIVVRMKAVSLNYRDWITVSGVYGGAHKLPLVPFSDGAGVVERIGEGVTRVKPGDRVTSNFFGATWIGGPPMPHKMAGVLGGPNDGCAQELMLISAEGVTKTPEHMSDVEASCLPCAALTAWRALVVDGALKAGDIALMQGTGGVSIFALQMAKFMGLTTIITSSSDEKLARCKALGADHVINYKTTPEWGGEARKLTGGRGVDLVVEVGGAGTLMESMKAVRQQGHIAIVGIVSGFGGEGLNMLPGMLIGNNARIQGLSVGSRENFEDMNRALTQNQSKPIVETVYPWTRAKEAFEDMQAGKHFGKIALTIG